MPTALLPYYLTALLPCRPNERHAVLPLLRIVAGHAEIDEACFVITRSRTRARARTRTLNPNPTPTPNPNPNPKQASFYQLSRLQQQLLEEEPAAPAAVRTGTKVLLS